MRISCRRNSIFKLGSWFVCKKCSSECRKKIMEIEMNVGWSWKSHLSGFMQTKCKEAKTFCLLNGRNCKELLLICNDMYTSRAKTKWHETMLVWLRFCLVPFLFFCNQSNRRKRKKRRKVKNTWQSNNISWLIMEKVKDSLFDFTFFC